MIDLDIGRSFGTMRIVALALLLTGATAWQQAPVRAGTTALRACNALNGPKDVHVTSSAGLATLEQGYRCLLRHYITGKTLDDRILLDGAYQQLVKTLGTQVLARTGATLPTLSGDRQADWLAFSRMYARLSASLQSLGPLQLNLGPVQQLLADLCLEGMVASLNDDHTGYLPAQFMKVELAQLNESGPIPSLGFIYSPMNATSEATLFITSIFPGSPAAHAGLAPGDVIQAVNGQPPYANGQPTASLLTLLLPQTGSPVSITLLRPVTGATMVVTLTPRLLAPPEVTAHVLPGNSAYVRLYAFTSHAADRVFAALRGLKLGKQMHGVVLDLRGNQGGAADQPVRIISAFVHHRILAYQIDGKKRRQPQRTNDAVALLHQPLAVLIDGDSASSSEIIAGAVRDLHLGRLIGARTAGALAGAEFYGLSDGSGLEITEVRIVGPDGERIDGIGVSPDEQAPVTAGELSAGRDPAIQRAIRYLQSGTPAA